MILGVLSDTHGHANRATVAVALLKRLGAEAIVHCGDVGGEAVLDALVGIPAWFVWGNSDYVDHSLEHYAESLGISPPRTIPTCIELGTQKIAVFHGHEASFGTVARRLEAGDAQGLARLLQGATYVLYGHTHLPCNERQLGVSFVNPGALHRARSYTVATIDLVTDAVDHWIVTDDMSTTARPQRYRLADA